jgi:multicomponent Na+:H+ antiporter subunit F
MTGDLFLFVSANIALGLLTLAVALTLLRLVRGPTLPDRVLALDLLATLAISLVGVLALTTGLSVYLDVALALCLVGFVASAALARYVLARRAQPDEQPAQAGEGRGDS